LTNERLHTSLVAVAVERGHEVTHITYRASVALKTGS
jgi:hypothetical protein